MAIKIEQHAPRPRSSRFSLGLSLRSHASHRRVSEKHNDSDSDDWYIPYHGPIEKPRLSPELRPRDSWGDLINTYAGDGALRDSDLTGRFENPRSDLLDAGDLDHEKAVGRRNRVLSGLSQRTTSSMAVDPNRPGSVMTRRTTFSRTGPQPLSSYSATGIGGGVGESPMPPQRQAHLAQSTVNSHRTTITNLFSFNTSSKKSRSPPSSATSDTRLSPPKPLSSLLRGNSFSEGKRDHPKTRGRREKAFAPEALPIAPAKTTDEAYYDSYYSTLISTPKADDRIPTLFHPPNIISQRHHMAEARDHKHNTNVHAFPSEPAQQLVSHPYAHVLPPAVHSDRSTTGQSSIARQHSQDTELDHRRQKPVTGTQPPISRPNTRKLRTSVSSPDLYTAARARNAPQGSNLKTKPPSKERWLAIETWCDAVVFPRPRFYVKQGGKEKRLMIITPPDTPIAATAFHHDDQNQEKRPPGGIALPVLQSRVLLHSRSQNDLRPTTADTGYSSLPSVTRRRGATLPNDMSSRQYPFTREITTTVSNDTGVSLRRPKTSTQDDGEPSSPVPSLTRVLEEGQQLNEMRQKWQMQATQSFQNKRTRSVSRARSKSLNSGNPRNNGRKEGETNKVMESFDYLATRTFLGSQSVMPTVHLAKPVHRSPEKGFGTGTFSTKSHSHSSSLAKSSSKSSKASGQRGHSRNESWGQSALKYAKSTAASLCGFSESSVSSPRDEETTVQENALKGGAGFVITMTDSDTRPLLHPNMKTNPITSEFQDDPPPNLWRNSPAPSGSFEGVGIALSTPPPGRCSPSHETDPISLPDHPYGQSSVTHHAQTAPAITYRPRDSWRGSDYAGPHPATVHMIVQGDVNDVSVRHRLPPQAILHPYAQATHSSHYSVEEAMKVHVRSDSQQIPPEERMWAQLSPSGIQEILPSDIVYSPYEATLTQSKPPEQVRKTHSTVSVGEALASSMRGRGNDIGRGEGHEMYPVITLSKHVKEELENDGKEERGGNDTSTAPLRIGHMRHPYGTALPEPTKLTPTKSDPRLDSPLHEAVHSSGSSPGMQSQSSSPQISPRPLGSMDDLDHFRDLFYKPSSLDAGELSSTFPWEIRSHRTGSGLTSLARQLSVELEELNARFDSSELAPLENSPGGGMRFVLSEARDSGSSRDVGPSSSLRLTIDDEKLSTFRPSFSVPEDVDSSRSSSVMRQSPLEDDTNTGPIRVGVVESISTPMAKATPRPLSGHVSMVEEDAVIVEDDEDATVRLRNPREREEQRQQGQEHEHEHEHEQERQMQPLSASLQLPPSAEATRSSYMTTSTNGSRMSGLSDFPAPPADIAAHMRLIEAYMAESSADGGDGVPEQLQLPPPPSEESASQTPVSRRMTFGGDEDIEDIAVALSSPA